MLAKFFAEMIGSFIFLIVFITTARSKDMFKNSQAWLRIGLTLAICIALFGYISGANFNFAISLMFYLDGELSFNDLILYGIAQLSGSFLAYFCYLRVKKYL